MDWPTLDLELPDSIFRYFGYEEQEGRDCTIVRKLVTDERPQTWNLRSESEWDSWFEKDRFLYEGHPAGGLCVLVCSRGKSHRGLSQVSYLPFSKRVFSAVARKFQVHLTTLRTIARGVPHFSRSYIQNGDSAKEPIVYTCRASHSWPDDIALSATHISGIGLTVAVIYGCNGKQRQKIVRRLEDCREAVCYPLLIAGIFAELERERLVARVEDLLDRFTLRTEMLGDDTRGWRQVLNGQGEKMSDLLSLYYDSRGLERGMRAVKAQLSKMLQHIEELQNKYHPKESIPKEEEEKWINFRNTGIRIQERLLEICEEYDRKIDDCNMIMEDLTMTTQLVMGHIARRESEMSNSIALETKRDNAQMRSIATLTMVCLPMTSVASVFSMGVFNWNPQKGQSVVTVYFWVFLGTAGGLTLLTITAWLLVTLPKRKRTGEKDVSKLV